MANLDQLADVHDSLVELLRTMDPRPLIEMLCTAIGIPRDAIHAIRERSPTIAVMSFARRARKTTGDVVFTVHDASGRIVLVVTFEVQLCWDATKRWTWALLTVAFGHEARAQSLVAVFTPDPVERARIRRNLLPKTTPRPIVIEPDQIELIDDVVRARRQPRETIFGALYHARETDEPIDARVAGVRAALSALRELAPDEQLRYGALMQSITPPEIMESALEDLPEDDEDEADSQVFPPWLRTGYGFVMGHREGLAESLSTQLITLRKVLVDILHTRGVEVEPAAQRAIEQCGDVATLAHWCTKASLVSHTLDDGFFD